MVPITHNVIHKGDTMKKKIIAIFCMISSVVLMLWYCFSDPASILKDKQVSEMGIYASQNVRTLWDLGYDPDDFAKADPGAGDFNYNAIFKGDALNRVIQSLKYPGSSYYILPKNTETYQGLYIINIPISDEEGFTFIIKDIGEESKGRFVGYKYKGRVNGSQRWLVYENARLGQILMELRSK